MNSDSASLTLLVASIGVVGTLAGTLTAQIWQKNVDDQRWKRELTRERDAWRREDRADTTRMSWKLIFNFFESGRDCIVNCGPSLTVSRRPLRALTFYPISMSPISEFTSSGPRSRPGWLAPACLRCDAGPSALTVAIAPQISLPRLTKITCSA